MAYGNSIGVLYPISPIRWEGYNSEYENIGLNPGASVVANLISKLLVIQFPNYHIAMDNYFTSPALLRHWVAMGVAATGTVRTNRMENIPLLNMVK